MTNLDKEATENLYNEIFKIINKKGLVYNSTYLNYSRIKINSFKTLLFDLDTGALSATITNQINKETSCRNYFWAKNVFNEEIPLSEVQQLLNEIKKDEQE